MSLISTNSLGTIFTSKNVIADIAGNVTTKCYGIVGMASRNKKDGIVNLLKHDNINKGINIIETEEQQIIVELHIIVEYGINISTVCKSITNRVRYTIENMVGTKIKSINVYVEGIRVSE